MKYLPTSGCLCSLSHDWVFSRDSISNSESVANILICFNCEKIYLSLLLIIIPETNSSLAGDYQIHEMMGVTVHCRSLKAFLKLMDLISIPSYLSTSVNTEVIYGYEKIIRNIDAELHMKSVLCSYMTIMAFPIFQFFDFINTGEKNKL